MLSDKLCDCGCGERTTLIAKTSAAQGRVKGEEMTRRARAQARFVEVVVPLVVLERSDGECGICGGDVDPANFHVDHIVPLARGGEHGYSNVQAAHPACNIAKGAALCP